MSIYDKSDLQIEGQMTIEQLIERPERLIAMHRIFARAIKQMNLAEWKTVVYALTKLDFMEKAKTDIVYLDKKTLAGIVGIEADSNHLSQDLKRAICTLKPHSNLQIDEEDEDLFDDGDFIRRVTMYKNRIRIRFDDEYLPLFTGFSEDPNYITMWSEDIFSMNSSRSVQFYEYLRQITDTRRSVNDILLGIKAIKGMFDIPMNGKGSYMKTDGHFNRTAFEQKVIDPICEDLKKCKMITLVIQPDGKSYEKVKRGNRVEGYRFFWTYTSHPGVASAKEVAQIQERVDEDPEILKVAKDILTGEKKKKKTGNKFNNFQQRDYDYEALEKELLKAQGTTEE